MPVQNPSVDAVVLVVQVASPRHLSVVSPIKRLLWTGEVAIPGSVQGSSSDNCSAPLALMANPPRAKHQSWTCRHYPLTLHTTRHELPLRHVKCLIAQLYSYGCGASAFSYWLSPRACSVFHDSDCATVVFCGEHCHHRVPGIARRRTSRQSYLSSVPVTFGTVSNSQLTYQPASAFLT